MRRKKFRTTIGFAGTGCAAPGYQGWNGGRAPPTTTISRARSTTNKASSRTIPKLSVRWGEEVQTIGFTHRKVLSTVSTAAAPVFFGVRRFNAAFFEGHQLVPKERKRR